METGAEDDLCGTGQELGFELFWSLDWLLYHLASLFPHCPVHACRKRSRAQLSRTERRCLQHPLFQAPKTTNVNTTLPPGAKGKKKESENREGEDKSSLPTPAEHAE